MRKPETPSKNESLKLYSVKDPLLFAIPNPFDDYLPEKRNWYVEIRKMEEVLRLMRERMNELAEMQQRHRNAIRVLREYCMTMPKKHRKN